MKTRCINTGQCDCVSKFDRKHIQMIKINGYCLSSIITHYNYIHLLISNASKLNDIPTKIIYYMLRYTYNNKKKV